MKTKHEYKKLKFPPYEWIKALPTKQRYEHITRDGQTIVEESYQDYSFILFDTPSSVYGRFNYNEDGEGRIIFDVMECGYCDNNRLGKSVKFNKKNYLQLCRHAQEVYEAFQRDLLHKDFSWQWEGKDPKTLGGF